MASRLFLFLNRASFGPAQAATALAVTAVAMGDEVTVVLGFEPLRAMVDGTFGAASNDGETVAVKRAQELGAASPERMLTEATALGARLIACDTTARLVGADAERLGIGVHGLATIWGEARGAQTLSF